jgi:hypothetical protein
VLDPEDRAIPDLWTQIHPSKRCDLLKQKNFQQTMDKVQNKESSNIIPSPKTFREELYMYTSHMPLIIEQGSNFSLPGNS